MSAAEPFPSPADIDGKSVQHQFTVQPTDMTPFARVRERRPPNRATYRRGDLTDGVAARKIWV